MSSVPLSPERLGGSGRASGIFVGSDPFEKLLEALKF